LISHSAAVKLSFRPVAGEISMRENGSLVAFETGQVTAYAIETAQERGQLFVKPGDQVGASRWFRFC
jgi:GTP-binding protein